MTDISIVSGTYNRLASLQRMVQSARDSVKDVLGLSLSFTLVDGGSRDGTIEWCKSQPDIILIEQGTLLGAVKAFNEGAYSAQADYVILANDDIEFVDNSIVKAWIYMQSNNECGIGCFYQNRNQRDWHVEEMPVVVDGEQAHRPYGQVCIVPKWLGDYVGWWCRDQDFRDKGFSPRYDEATGQHLFLKTYGGDNQLSSKVYELGFKVSPVPGARISDHEVQDDLRKINNAGQMTDPRKTGGHNPDSWAWGRFWKHLDIPGQPVGPIIKHYPMLENPITSKHRIIYLPIFEQGWSVQKQQKRGLREALAKVALTVEYDYIGRFTAIGKDAMLAELNRTMRQIQPTLFLSQLHNGAQINHEDVFHLRQNWPDTKFINWNGDYWPDNLLSEDGIKLAKAFDWQLTVNRDADEKYQAMGVNSSYWQIGFEPDGIGHTGDYDFDVVFLASGYSQARKDLVSRLRTGDYNFGLFGPGWKDAKGQTIYNFIEGCKIYRGSKISIGDSQWPETGFVSNRVFQALAAGGAALAHQWFRGMEQLGLEDGKTCIIWRDFAELEKKIKYYLLHENERKALALNGEQLALERHSFDNRVSELLELISDEKEESWR